ncbi:F5/8 type C domain [Burkholderia pseudomallei]|uniref:discoidin domain-containing protein n=1 Tax=Burkholderia pseudomallei TaxID=28450 RepID=UPI0005DA7D98|nr:discoidin domain-containing protein [Burkholderia pseudomallei]CAK1277484.1 F5/8 type C domain [Burkholderia pseudomallei]
MSAHTYWRLSINYTAGGAVAAIAEFSLHTSIGGGQAASGGTPSASSVFSTDTASLAFDGSASTFWASAASGVNSWLQYQFASAVDIVEYAITARNDSFYNQAPESWYLQYSDDGSTWTTADTVYYNQWTQGSTATFTTGANTGVANGAAIGKALKSNGPAYESAPAAFTAVQVGKAPTPGPHTVSGTVTVNGTATGGLLVRAYAKATGEFIGQATSASDGTYSIKCGVDWADVYVIAFDPTTYQAVIYDQVAPG